MPPWRDAALVAALVALSTAPYVGGLGFYSDDWAFLSSIAAHIHSGLADPLAQLLAQNRLIPRPGQAAYLVGMYALFGAEPLPSHLVNSAALAAAAVMCLLALRELRVPAAGAFAIAATYALLPHYATDRMWIATHQATFSMTLYFASLYAELRLVNGGRGAWKAVGLAALAGSLLLYEVALPMLMANSLLMVVLLRRSRGDAPRRSRAAAAGLHLVNVALVVAIALFKARYSDRMRHDGTLAAHITATITNLLDPYYRWQTDYGLNVFAALDINFGLLGALLPWSAWRVTAAAHDPWAIAVAAAIGLAVWLRLAGAVPAWDRATSVRVIAAGLVVLALGYAIFLTNDNMNFSPTGIANRVAIAGTLGVATCFVGVSSLVAYFTPPKWRARIFAGMVALVCACGSLINSGIGTWWKEAYRKELAILERLDRDAPDLRAGDTIILAGACPYAGPAPVFEASWDFANAVSLRRNVRPLTGDVVSERMTVGADGLHTSLYEVPYVYPYGPGLGVYNALTGAFDRLGDHATAERYFASRAALPACPESFTGQGVLLF